MSINGRSNGEHLAAAYLRSLGLTAWRLNAAQATLTTTTTTLPTPAKPARPRYTVTWSTPVPALAMILRLGWIADNFKNIVAMRQRMGYTVGMGQLTRAIQAAVKASEQTPYAIAKGAGVARSQLSRLLSGERGLNSETIERLADYLELEIVIQSKRTQKGR